MKSILKIGTAIVIAATSIWAADQHLGTKMPEYRGRVATLDPGAGTLSVVTSRSGDEHLVLVITPNTRFLRNGQYISPKGVKIGEEVSGDYGLTKDGKRVALTVYLGSRPYFKPSNQPSQLPVAKRIPGKPNLVYCPFDPSRRPIDVDGLPSGSKALDPLTQKVFIIGP